MVTQRHPCCASAHRAIDALLDLKQEYGFLAGDITRIEAKVSISAGRNLAYPDLTDEMMQARFSMQYCLATAFLKGALSLSDFARQEIGPSEIREFMPRIEMQPIRLMRKRAWSASLPSSPSGHATDAFTTGPACRPRDRSMHR